MRKQAVFLVWFLLTNVIFLVSCKKEERNTISSTVKPKKEVKIIDEDLEKWKNILKAGTYHTRLVGYGNPFAPFFKEKPREKPRKPLSPLERWSLKELKLTGIVQKGKRRWALIEDPSGKGYMVSVGTRIGQNEGYLAKIGNDYILVKEKSTDFLGNEIIKEIVIKLRPTEENHEVP